MQSKFEPGQEAGGERVSRRSRSSEACGGAKALSKSRERRPGPGGDTTTPAPSESETKRRARKPTDSANTNHRAAQPRLSLQHINFNTPAIGVDQHRRGHIGIRSDLRESARSAIAIGCGDPDSSRSRHSLHKLIHCRLGRDVGVVCYDQREEGGRKSQKPNKHQTSAKLEASQGAK